MTKRQPQARGTRRTMTHKERLALIYAQVPETRVLPESYRRAGVFVNDYFGEGLIKHMRKRRLHGSLQDDGLVGSYTTDFSSDPLVTSYDSRFFVEDYARLAEEGYKVDGFFGRGAHHTPKGQAA